MIVAPEPGRLPRPAGFGVLPLEALDELGEELYADDLSRAGLAYESPVYAHPGDPAR